MVELDEWFISYSGGVARTLRADIAALQAYAVDPDDALATERVIAWLDMIDGMSTCQMP